MPSFKMKFTGVTILQGVEFSIFPIDFEWALQQCSATALPVIKPLYLLSKAGSLIQAEGPNHLCKKKPRASIRRYTVIYHRITPSFLSISDFPQAQLLS